MRRNDFLLILVLLMCGGILFAINMIITSSGGNEVVVSVNGEEFGRYLLDRDAVIDLNGTNVLQIRDGEAFMKEANCRDLICVHHKAISGNGESIVCMPNRIVVEVVSDEESQLDTIAE